MFYLKGVERVKENFYLKGYWRGIDFRFQDIRSLFNKEFLSTRIGKLENTYIFCETDHLERGKQWQLGCFLIAILLQMMHRKDSYLQSNEYGYSLMCAKLN